MLITTCIICSTLTYALILQHIRAFHIIPKANSNYFPWNSRWDCWHSCSFFDSSLTQTQIRTRYLYGRWRISSSGILSRVALFIATVAKYSNLTYLWIFFVVFLGCYDAEAVLLAPSSSTARISLCFFLILAEMGTKRNWKEGGLLIKTKPRHLDSVPWTAVMVRWTRLFQRK